MKSDEEILMNLFNAEDEEDLQMSITLNPQLKLFIAAMDEARREAVAEKDRVIAELNLALNEAEKKIKQLDTKPY